MFLINTTFPSCHNQAKFHHDCDWNEYFPDALEYIPAKSPPPFGETVYLTAYIDADHAQDHVTRRSVTGILLLNNTPIAWISKRQRTVETSTFGLEMIAARILVDLIVEMRYKLPCLGLPVEHRNDMIGDNLSVVVNTTLPSSKTKKKHLICSIMRVREAVAAGFVRFGHICSELNIADIAIKPFGPHAFHQIAHPYLFRHLATHKDNRPTDNADILSQPAPYQHYTQPRSKKIHSCTNPMIEP